jgi:hypothetical protein
MTNDIERVTTFVNILGPLFLGFALIASGQDKQSIAKAVDDLGKAENNVALVKLMAADPSKAVGLLVSQLRTVPGVKLTNGQHQEEIDHIFWTTRALKFLTGGKDFCVPTAHKFAKTEEEQDREYWLRFHNHNCLRFFSLWPSRGTVYIAPRDVQEKIIAQWKEWYRVNGKSYHYKPLVDPRPEDWLW